MKIDSKTYVGALEKSKNDVGNNQEFHDVDLWYIAIWSVLTSKQKMIFDIYCHDGSQNCNKDLADICT